MLNPTHQPSTSRFYALRLTPGEDVFGSLRKFVRSQNLKAAYIAGCVGSLTGVAIRFAGRSEIRHMVGKYEVVSLIGTLDAEGGHVHLSVSDENGVVVGGHMSMGCTVRTTLELVIGELEDLIFSREICPQSGYAELAVSARHQTSPPTNSSSLSSAETPKPASPLDTIETPAPAPKSEPPVSSWAAAVTSKTAPAPKVLVATTPAAPVVAKPVVPVAEVKVYFAVPIVGNARLEKEKDVRKLKEVILGEVSAQLEKINITKRDFTSLRVITNETRANVFVDFVIPDALEKVQSLSIFGNRVNPTLQKKNA